jgi:hypothetical protein
MHSHPIRFNVVFPRNYEAKILESYSLLNPLEKLHHFPAMLEEGDRSGIYARVTAHHGISWIGFFAMGFESEHVARGLYSCPDRTSS